MRGILDAGGDIRKDWDLGETLKIGDRATGTHVLVDLYGQMKDQPVNVDIAALWKELGVVNDNGAVHFQDEAPLAAVRRSITAGVLAKATGAAAAARPLTIFAGRTPGRL